ncbi:hypothetical protein [Nocardiopsis sp. FR26]|uniref:hypothetical protein n=1 Tax=Nocardiopsis sp. FR26 TaxID=2605987 RepID=UPI001916B4ED|nr:hypothetical protein [Nocardiopsis sp. FR26]
MSTPEPLAPAEKDPSAALSPLLTAATLVVVLALGVLAGLLSTTGAGWLTRYWGAGQPVPALAVAALLVFLALLYTGCRLCAWGSRRPSAAVFFAVGFLASVIALVGYVPGGDLVLTNHLMHNAYLFGSMLVLVLAVIRSRVFLPASALPRPESAGQAQNWSSSSP